MNELFMYFKCGNKHAVTVSISVNEYSTVEVRKLTENIVSILCMKFNVVKNSIEKLNQEEFEKLELEKVFIEI